MVVDEILSGSSEIGSNRFGRWPATPQPWMEIGTVDIVADRTRRRGAE
jgi:hypothetical protein